MDTLTDSQKTSIRAEEVYRSEVRGALQKDLDQKPSLWSFLNSSLGIWVLSSLLLTGITTMYGCWSDYNSQRQKNAELVIKLNEEITYRINQSLSQLAITQSDIDKGTAYSAVSIYSNIASYLDNGFLATTHQDFSLLPEFKDRTFSSLLGQLYDMSDPKDRDQIKRAFYGYQEICTKGSLDLPATQPELVQDKELATGAVTDVKDIINQRILLKQWSGGIW